MTTLSHNECWDLYDQMRKDECYYHYRESGKDSSEYLARTDPKFAFKYYEAFLDVLGTPRKVFVEREAAFEDMEVLMAQQHQYDEDQMYWPYSKDIFAQMNEDYFNHHHIEPEGKPQWQSDVERISSLLTKC